MIDFSEEIDYPSKQMEGVIFRIRRLNIISRTKRDEAVADELIEHNELLEDIGDFRVEHPEAFDEEGEIKAKTGLNRSDAKRLNKLIQKLEAIRTTMIIPNVIRGGFVSATGLAKDPITSANALLRMPLTASAIGDLYGACDAASRMSPEDLGNWLRPGTSSEPATPETANTIAGTASEKSSTKAETVVDISPAT